MITTKNTLPVFAELGALLLAVGSVLRRSIAAGRAATNRVAI